MKQAYGTYCITLLVAVAFLLVLPVSSFAEESLQRIPKELHVTVMCASNPPIATVQPGETFIVEAYDCFSGLIDCETQIFSETVPWENVNPATGPIIIEGAEPGDILVVSIDTIEIGDQGVMVTAPGMGVIGHLITEETTSIIPIVDGYAIFSPEIHLPIRPMIGTIGVAPAEEPIITITPCAHGGNMDFKEVTEGTRLFLPVFHPGALFAMGDAHAIQGDGEVSVTGLEIDIEATLTIDLLKDKMDVLPYPMLSNDEYLYVIHSELTLDEAVINGVAKTVRFLQNYTRLNQDEAIRLLSLASNVGIAQAVDPQLTIYVEIPWWILNNLGVTEASL